MLFDLFHRSRSSIARLLMICLGSFTPFFCQAANSVTLDWDPSPNPEVTSYNIYYGIASLTYSNMVSTGSPTGTTISGLVPGQTYYFAVTATDGTGLESDFSNEASCVIPLPASNQQPTLNALASVTISENAGVQTISLAGITSGDLNEIQTLIVTATSADPSLIPQPAVSYLSPGTTGSLTFTPVAFASGSTTITVTVNDGGAGNNLITRSFQVTVSPVNQQPTLNALPDFTINENTGVQTVNLSGITAGAGNEVQPLTVTASSSNSGLIPNPAVSYLSPNSTGSISFTPVPNANGQAVVTVTVSDGGASNNFVNRAFTVSVNQRPTLSTIASRVVSVGAPTPALVFIIGDAETAAGSLVLSGTSSNPALVQNAGIVFGGSGANRTVTVTPLPGQSGSANITVIVSDGLATASTVFQVRTKPVAPGNLQVAVVP